MSHVNLYNAEGYLDPTAYEALTRIEREAKKTAFRPLVFISSPFAGDTRRNTKRARGLRCQKTVSPSRRTSCSPNSWRRTIRPSATSASFSAWCS